MRHSEHAPGSRLSPHTAGPSARAALVCHGAIENIVELRARVMSYGCQYSGNDPAALLAHLVEHELACAPDFGLSIVLRNALAPVRGHYALAMLSRNWPRTVVAVQHGRPLLVAPVQGGVLVTSDAASLATTRFTALEDGELVVCTPEGARRVDRPHFAQ